MGSLYFFIACMVAFLGFAAWKKKLTMGGCVAAALLGCCIFAGVGMPGIFVIGCFFMLAVLATQWGMAEKVSLGAAEQQAGRRDAGQVLANGGMAGLLGAWNWLAPGPENLLFLMLAGAMSSATADTLSSELGTLYGKKYVNILDFRKGIRGENGVVSLEGTLIGMGGSCIIALIVYLQTGTLADILIIVIAGTFGNGVDSLLGGTLERKKLLSNNAVNFLNTLCAAAIAGLLVYV